MLGDKYGTADIIPVDIAINTMIVSAWDNAVNKLVPFQYNIVYIVYIKYNNLTKLDIIYLRKFNFNNKIL